MTDLAICIGALAVAYLLFLGFKLLRRLPVEVLRPTASVFIVISVILQAVGWAIEANAPQRSFGSSDCADIPTYAGVPIFTSMALAFVASVAGGITVRRGASNKNLVFGVIALAGSILLWLSLAANGLCQVTNS